MPFELGLAVASKPHGHHDWFVFEERRHRLTKSLSDLNGTDPHIHEGHPDGVLRALSNALVRRRHRPSAARRCAAGAAIGGRAGIGVGDRAWARSSVPLSAAADRGGYGSSAATGTGVAGTPIGATELGGRSAPPTGIASHTAR